MRRRGEVTTFRYRFQLVGWVLFAFSLSSLSAMPGQATPEVERRSPPLFHGKSVRVEHERLLVHSLFGTPREIGYATGILAPRESWKKGMIHYMSTYAENLVHQIEWIKNFPPLQWLVGPFLAFRYYRPFEKKILQDEREYVAGYAQATGIPRWQVIKALLNPDVVHVAIADYLEERLFSWGASPFGCSTFVIPASKASQGKLIFARGQDYPGFKVFDEFPSIYYVSKPGKYRHVSVTSAGIALGGITSMNEWGLTLSLHAAASRDDSGSEGYPVLSVTGRMLEEARKIEQAHQICNRHVPASGWIMNLADVHEGKARSARLEVNAAEGKCHLEWVQGFMVTTNHYFRESNRKREIGGGPSIESNSQARYDRILELLNEKAKAGVKTEDAMKILADRMDPQMDRHAGYAPSAVAALDQISTAIFVPENLEFWVSNGRAPVGTSGKYVRFRFRDFENLHESLRGRDTRYDVSLSALLAGTPNDPRHWPGFEFYQESARHFDPHGKMEPQSALKWMNKAVEAEPGEPVYHLVRGMLLLRLNRPADAIPDLATVEAHLGMDAHRKNVARLYHAKALDALQRRAEAKTLYLQILENPEVHAKLRKVAIARLETPLLRKELSRIQPDFKYADTLDYD